MCFWAIFLYSSIKFCLTVSCLFSRTFPFWSLRTSCFFQCFKRPRASTTKRLHKLITITTTQVVDTKDTANNNSPFQEYVHPGDHTQPTYEMTPGFKPFTVYLADIFRKAVNMNRGLFCMSMRDRWTSDVQGGSPQGLPSSKWRFSKPSSRLFFSLVLANVLVI